MEHRQEGELARAWWGPIPEDHGSAARLKRQEFRHKRIKSRLPKQESMLATLCHEQKRNPNQSQTDTEGQLKFDLPHPHITAWKDTDQSGGLGDQHAFLHSPIHLKNYQFCAGP